MSPFSEFLSEVMGALNAHAESLGWLEMTEADFSELVFDENAIPIIKIHLEALREFYLNNLNQDLFAVQYIVALLAQLIEALDIASPLYQRKMSDILPETDAEVISVYLTRIEHDRIQLIQQVGHIYKYCLDLYDNPVIERNAFINRLYHVIQQPEYSLRNLSYEIDALHNDLLQVGYKILTQNQALKQKQAALQKAEVVLNDKQEQMGRLTISFKRERYLMKSATGRYHFCEAIIAGDIDDVNIGLSFNSVLDADGNAQTSLIEMVDCYGKSALSYAIEYDRLDILKLFLRQLPEVTGSIEYLGQKSHLDIFLPAFNVEHTMSNACLRLAKKYLEAKTIYTVKFIKELRGSVDHFYAYADQLKGYPQNGHFEAFRQPLSALVEVARDFSPYLENYLEDGRLPDVKNCASLQSDMKTHLDALISLNAKMVAEEIGAGSHIMIFRLIQFTTQIFEGVNLLCRSQLHLAKMPQLNLHIHFMHNQKLAIDELASLRKTESVYQVKTLINRTLIATTNLMLPTFMLRLIDCLMLAVISETDLVNLINLVIPYVNEDKGLVSNWLLFRDIYSKNFLNLPLLERKNELAACKSKASIGHVKALIHTSLTATTTTMMPAYMLMLIDYLTREAMPEEALVNLIDQFVPDIREDRTLASHWSVFPNFYQLHLSTLPHVELEGEFAQLKTEIEEHAQGVALLQRAPSLGRLL